MYLKNICRDGIMVSGTEEGVSQRKGAMCSPATNIMLRDKLPEIAQICTLEVKLPFPSIPFHSLPFPFLTDPSCGDVIL
jgi:hypothetical protein